MRENIAMKGKDHMHNLYRPYLCDSCGSRFFRSSTLKAHMKRHTNYGGREAEAAENGGVVPDDKVPVMHCKV